MGGMGSSSSCASLELSQRRGFNFRQMALGCEVSLKMEGGVCPGAEGLGLILLRLEVPLPSSQAGWGYMQPGDPLSS